MIVEQLLKAACDRVGSEDFGDDTWQEGLDVLVGSLNEEYGLNEVGREVIAGQMVDHLAKRLDVEQWYGAHPEIDDEAIVAPRIGLVSTDRLDGVELPACQRSGAAIIARLGGGQAVPSSGDGKRAR